MRHILSVNDLIPKAKDLRRGDTQLLLAVDSAQRYSIYPRRISEIEAYVDPEFNQNGAYRVVSEQDARAVVEAKDRNCRNLDYLKLFFQALDSLE